MRADYRRIEDFRRHWPVTAACQRTTQSLLAWLLSCAYYLLSRLLARLAEARHDMVTALLTRPLGIKHLLGSRHEVRPPPQPEPSKSIMALRSWSSLLGTGSKTGATQTPAPVSRTAAAATV